MALTRSLIVAIGLLVLAVAPAQAQFDLLPEIRGGVLARGVGQDGMAIEDANLEVLFAVPALSPALVPAEIRPHLGATLSTAGKESFVYGGLSLTARVPLVPVFGEVSIGGALHNGAMLGNATPQRFGCAALLRASASVGVDVLPGVSVMGTLEHYTDGGLCDMPDTGLTNAGLRAGIRF
ncbi:MAG TPA: acyloxyacyl hydrolase [Devosia sp.]|nr:acyloxyacyl hydrolase [Devosia sp.]